MPVSIDEIEMMIYFGSFEPVKTKDDVNPKNFQSKK